MRKIKQSIIMKNTLLTLIILVSVLSCVGQKKIAKESHKIEKKKEIAFTKDSSKVIDRSLAINDKILLSLKTNDKKIDSIIRLRLNGFETQKKSGKNYYKAKFDYNKLALSIASIIGETKSTIVEKNTEKNTKEDTKQSYSEYLYEKVKVMPWWFWGIIAFWLLPQIIDRIKFFANPFKKVLLSLLKGV